MYVEDALLLLMFCHNKGGTFCVTQFLGKWGSGRILTVAILFQLYEILILDKNLKQGSSGNSGPVLGLRLMLGPHSQNGPLLGPYSTCSI
jgi:hypothetical protein